MLRLIGMTAAFAAICLAVLLWVVWIPALMVVLIGGGEAARLVCGASLLWTAGSIAGWFMRGRAEKRKRAEAPLDSMDSLDVLLGRRRDGGTIQN